MANELLNVSNMLAKDAIKETLLPWMYYTVGVVLVCVWIIGFLANFAVLYTFSKNKRARTTDTCLIMGLALSDIGQTLFGIPFVIVSSFQKGWIFGMPLCHFYAFITTTLGIAQITTLTSIAVDRYFIIVHYERRLTNIKQCALVIGFSFLYGCLWGTGPMLGWSNFKLEETELACCATWEGKGAVDLSYTISICTFAWLIPLLIIMYAYMCIACTTYKKRNQMNRSLSTKTSHRRNRERKVATTVLIMIGTFVISWMPYAILSLWSAFGDFNSIPLAIQVIPAIFAKCSIIWNPLIYVARHKQFRNGVVKSLNVCQHVKAKHSANAIELEDFNCDEDGEDTGASSRFQVHNGKVYDTTSLSNTTNLITILPK